MAHNGHRWPAVLVSTWAAFVLTSPAFAQQTAPSSSQPGVQVPSSPDFMLGEPRLWIGARGGWLFASAGSDIYDFVTDQLTVEKSNFNGGSFALDFGVAVAPRTDVVFGFDVNRSRTPSEYRAFIDNFGLPIEQTTELKQFNLTASARFNLVPKGREISRLAWIPNTWVPYVGAGGGVGQYSFQQYGDFVDFVDNHVFTDLFESKGWTPLAHVFGGVDVRVFKQVLLSFEGRYTWSHAELERDFIDFDPIDLGGTRFGVGVNFTF